MRTKLRNYHQVVELSAWIDRRHWDVGYAYLAQLFSVHRYINALSSSRYGKPQRSDCLNCPRATDTANALSLSTADRRWHNRRTSLELDIGPIEPDSIVEQSFVESGDNKKQLTHVVEAVLRAKYDQTGEIAKSEQSMA